METFSFPCEFSLKALVLILACKKQNNKSNDKLDICLCVSAHNKAHLSPSPEPMFGSWIQFTQLWEAHLTEWSRPVCGAVHSLVVHQYGDSVCRELEVQLHTCRPVLTGLARDRWTTRKKRMIFKAECKTRIYSHLHLNHCKLTADLTMKRSQKRVCSRAGHWTGILWEHKEGILQGRAYMILMKGYIVHKLISQCKAATIGCRDFHILYSPLCSV